MLIGQVETEETENGNGKLKRKTEAESGNGKAEKMVVVVRNINGIMYIVTRTLGQRPLLITSA